MVSAQSLILCKTEMVPEASASGAVSHGKKKYDGIDKHRDFTESEKRDRDAP